MHSLLKVNGEHNKGCVHPRSKVLGYVMLQIKFICATKNLQSIYILIINIVS